MFFELPAWHDFPPRFRLFFPFSLLWVPFVYDELSRGPV